MPAVIQCLIHLYFLSWKWCYCRNPMASVDFIILGSGGIKWTIREKKQIAETLNIRISDLTRFYIVCFNFWTLSKNCMFWAIQQLVITKFIMTSSNGNIFRVSGPLCGEFTGPGDFPTQGPVTRSFDVFFDLRLNKPLSKQSWGWWFETLSRSLWRHRYVWMQRRQLIVTFFPSVRYMETVLIK